MKRCVAAKRRGECDGKGGCALQGGRGGAGDLLSIDYSWGEMRLYSKTRYELEDCEEEARESRGIDVQPEDINISDTATFVWEIKSC